MNQKVITIKLLVFLTMMTGCTVLPEFKFDELEIRLRGTKVNNLQNLKPDKYAAKNIMEL